MLKTLPETLLQAVASVGEVLEACVSCGAVVGSCPHTYSFVEDTLSKQLIPGEDEPEEELSGEKEDVVINPEYKTFVTRRPV